MMIFKESLAEKMLQTVYQSFSWDYPGWEYLTREQREAGLNLADMALSTVTLSKSVDYASIIERYLK